jgi:hypothetical protein
MRRPRLFVRMNPLQLYPGRPRRVRRPTTLDELHRHARAAVAKLTDSTSVASPTLSVEDIPKSAAGHAVTGQFRLASADAAVPRCFRARLFRLRFAFGKRYRSCQITIVPSLARALSALFTKEGSVRVGEPLMHALATLIHEEFHAVHYVGWPGLVQDRVLETPGVRQLTEGIIELGIEELFPSILPELGLGGLKKAVPFLQTRRAYVAQHEAARALIDHIAALERAPATSVLTRALKYGSGVIALRTLAHDIARARDVDDRIADWKWNLARFQAELPPGAERQIVQEIVAPFEDLAGWFRNTADVFGDTASEQGRRASSTAIQRLDDFMKTAA